MEAMTKVSLSTETRCGGGVPSLTVAFQPEKTCGSWLMIPTDHGLDLDCWHCSEALEFIVSEYGSVTETNKLA